MIKLFLSLIFSIICRLYPVYLVLLDSYPINCDTFVPISIKMILINCFYVNQADTKSKNYSHDTSCIYYYHINVQLFGISSHLFIYELDSDILRSFIFKMISASLNEIVYGITGTKNYSDNEFKERRLDFLKNSPIVGEHITQRVA